MRPWQFKLWQKSLLGVSAVLISPLAQAHDGSLSSGLLAGLGHPLSGVDHLVALLLAGLLLGRLVTGRRLLTLGGFLLALGLGAAGGIFLGTQLWVEAAILLSLPVFLALQWLRDNVQLQVAGAVVGVFMVAHGWAHGVEMTGMNAAFIFGFLLTSAIIMGLSCLFGVALYSRKKTRTAASHA